MAVRRLAAASITAYLRHLSPRKGFCCAHRRLHGGESCSAHIKHVVLTEGLWQAAREARHRFAECRQASLAMQAEGHEGNDRKRPGPCADDGSEFCAGLACDAGCTALGEGLLSLLSGWGVGCGG